LNISTENNKIFPEVQTILTPNLKGGHYESIRSQQNYDGFSHVLDLNPWNIK
jgi:hypothetical protein